MDKTEVSIIHLIDEACSEAEFILCFTSARVDRSLVRGALHRQVA